MRQQHTKSALRAAGLRRQPCGLSALGRTSPPEVGSTSETGRPRLAAPGATRGERHEEPTTGSWWIVLHDPEGNELCSCQDPPSR